VVRRALEKRALVLEVLEPCAAASNIATDLEAS
jgi:hypothetical protein